MKLDLTSELARLLNFTADVATAIRLYSAYNQSGQLHDDAPLDLMWLSDSLHNYSMLGNAVLGGDRKNIVFACDMLLKTYQDYQQIHPTSTRQSKPTFDRNAKRVHLIEAITIFTDIRTKALSVQAYKRIS